MSVSLLKPANAVLQIKPKTATKQKHIILHKTTGSLMEISWKNTFWMNFYECFYEKCLRGDNFVHFSGIILNFCNSNFDMNNQEM